jgi:hypothetical protein
VLIHKIHRGEALEQQPYIIYGFGQHRRTTPERFRRSAVWATCASARLATSRTRVPAYPGTAPPTAHSARPSRPETRCRQIQITRPRSHGCARRVTTATPPPRAATETAPDPPSVRGLSRRGRAFAVSLLHADGTELIRS